MNALETKRFFSLRYVTMLLTVLLFGGCIASADDKKPSAPVKATPPKPAPSRSAPAPTHVSVPSGHTTNNPGGHTTAGSTGRATNPTAGTTTSTARRTPANPMSRAAANPNGGTNTNTTGRTAVNTTTRSATNPIGRTTPSAPGHGTTGAPKSTTSSAGVTKPLPKDHIVFRTKNGDLVTKRPGGRVASVHDERRHMDIHHDLHGGRRVDVRRGDHRIVVERGRRGFVERPYRFRGREYAHRTYYYHGRAYDHFYHGYYYRGVFVQMYAPTYYYAPAFYGWAYTPWVTPVPYAWGWVGNPWYAYYGYYFAPYPVYPSASLWLTDYLIATTLAAAYEEGVEAAAQVQAQAEGFVALSPQVKELIAAEVQRQIAIEYAESRAGTQSADPNPSMSGVQAMLGDNVRHIFIAGRSIDVVDASGTECAISEGDALQLTSPPTGGSTVAKLAVLSTKGGQECRAGSNVSVEVTDLQDMQNHMRETIDQGMSELQTKQGSGGLPALPPSASAPPVKAAFAVAAPGPEASAASEIAEQSQEADEAENEAVSQASPNAGSGPPALGGQSPRAAPPAPFEAMGKSTDEVIAQFGQPRNIVALGTKKIYIYANMKITFKDGKVIDLE